MKALKSIIILSSACVILATASLGNATKLKKGEYSKNSNEMGVVLLDVNWGRQWNCAGFENAQLKSLKFKNTSINTNSNNKYTEINLESPSRLFSKPKFISHGFLVNPGTYEFTEWSVKVAKSSREVGYINVGEDALVDNGVFHGGTVEVGANEIIYVGNFYLDCYKSPIPWRYYTEGRANFENHIKQYKKKFKFLKNYKVIYRLLDTNNFGEKYVLPN